MERINESKSRTFKHHIKRYEFVSKFVADKNVYSLACGTGYGEFFLIKEGRAKSVTGIDISGEAIDLARSHYSYPGLAFIEADIGHADLRENSAEVFVSLETIEHINDDLGFLKEIHKCLKPGGMLIISTPNRALSWRNLFSRKPLNPFHVREYRKDELEKLLKRYFADVTFYGQKKILKRSIWSIWRYIIYKITRKIEDLEKEEFEVIEYPTDQKFETAYFIAVCKK